MKSKLLLILSIVLSMLALPALTNAAGSCTCGGKAKCELCCGDKCSDCKKDCCATKAPAKREVPTKSAASCSCGGKEKCKKCCGEKCSDCCKDCCKSK